MRESAVFALERKALTIVRTAAWSVPALGCPLTFFRSDPKVLDAMFTLAAIGHDERTIAQMIDCPRVTPQLVLATIGRSVSLQLLAILETTAYDRI